MKIEIDSVQLQYTYRLKYDRHVLRHLEDVIVVMEWRFLVHQLSEGLIVFSH